MHQEVEVPTQLLNLRSTSELDPLRVRMRATVGKAPENLGFVSSCSSHQGPSQQADSSNRKVFTLRVMGPEGQRFDARGGMVLETRPSWSTGGEMRRHRLRGTCVVHLLLSRR